MNKKPADIFDEAFKLNVTGFDNLLDYRNVGLPISQRKRKMPQKENTFVLARYLQLQSGEAPLDSNEQLKFNNRKNVREEDYI